ncbi:hypothetical protein UT300005_07020 [Clostridium sp. CTA-5]
MRIYLNNFNMENFKELYSIKCEKENIYWTNYINKPDEKKFYKWCLDQLKNKNRQIFIARDFKDDIAVGYGYIDLKKDSTEISYAISSKFMGQGLGNKIVKLLIEYCIKNYKTIKKIEAWILENNIKSKKCILRNGLKETEEKRVIYFEPTDSITSMIKFEYSFS